MDDEAKQWVAVTVLVFRGDRMLTMQRASDARAGTGIWEGVSGRVRDAEDPSQAAVREVREETGLQVVLEPRPVDAYAARRNDEAMTVIVFSAVSAKGEVVLSEEHDAFRWCTHAELTQLGVPPRLIQAAALAWPESP